jgi:hypothetical protein
LYFDKLSDDREVNEQSETRSMQGKFKGAGVDFELAGIADGARVPFTRGTGKGLVVDDRETVLDEHREIDAAVDEAINVVAVEAGDDGIFTHQARPRKALEEMGVETVGRGERSINVESVDREGLEGAGESSVPDLTGEGGRVASDSGVKSATENVHVDGAGKWQPLAQSDRSRTSM